MDNFKLDKKLAEDSYQLGKLDSSHLLLMRNAHFPWFVIVPETDAIEFHTLDQQQQLGLLNQINVISRFVEENFSTDKLNIGCIGNVVSQLHIHVVGRSKDDICWPNVVWGINESKTYDDHEVLSIKDKLQASLRGTFKSF